MEMAKHICENLSQLEPNKTYVAYTANSIGHFSSGCFDPICNMNNTKIVHLRISNGVAVGDSRLKSLLYRTVFETRTMSSNDRGNKILEEINAMLPNLYSSVFVSVPIANSNECPLVYGPHKGVANYWEPEFGDHICIILH